MDIKAKITEIVEKIKKDPTLKDEFTKNPEKAIEKLIGVDIPDGAVDSVVSGVKAKLTGDKLADAAEAIKKIF
ncbi:MAG: hypothetical protein CW335_05015 [Clostridiales bacterium]|nr:hypothetical protein [Clostridiales bacterium]